MARTEEAEGDEPGVEREADSLMKPTAAAMPSVLPPLAAALSVMTTSELCTAQTWQL